MKKIILNVLLSFTLVLPVFAQFPDDFEDLDVSDWTQSGSISVSISQNHTGGGMASMLGIATFSQPAEATKVETGAASGETWVVEGWVYRSAGYVEFGWLDNLGSIPQVGSSGSWTYITDTCTFQPSDTKAVDFWVQNLGATAYLDDVNTFEIIVEPTLAPEISDIPDLKLFQTTQTLNDAFDLESFNTGSMGTAHAIVNNPLTKASLAGSVVSQASHNVATTINQSFSVTNTVGGLTTAHKVKYSTYKIKKLPKIGLNPRSSVVIDMSKYMIDSTGPVIPKNMYSWDGLGIGHSWDPTTTYMTITAYSYFTVGYSSSTNWVKVAISPDITNWADLVVDRDVEELPVYVNILPQSTFSTANDTAAYGYEPAPGKATLVAPTHNTAVADVSGDTAYGVITYTFADNQSGVKATAISGIRPPYAADEWYTARMRVFGNSGNNHQSILFNFSNEVAIGGHVDVAGTVLLGTPSTWTWIEAPIYSHETGFGQPQYQFKAGGAGSVNIDEIQIIPAAPTLIDASRGNTKYQYSGGNFDVTGDTDMWGKQGYAIMTGGVVFDSAQAGTSVSAGKLNIDFAGAGSGANQLGIKWTASTTGTGTGIITPASTIGRQVGTKAEVTVSSGTFNTLGSVLLLAVFGTQTNNGSPLVNGTELFASAEFGRITDGTHYVAGNATNGFHQFQFGAKKDGSGVLSIDNADFLSDNDDPNYGDGSLFP